QAKKSWRMDTRTGHVGPRGGSKHARWRLGFLWTVEWNHLCKPRELYDTSYLGPYCRVPSSGAARHSAKARTCDWQPRSAYWSSRNLRCANVSVLSWIQRRPLFRIETSVRNQKLRIPNFDD